MSRSLRTRYTFGTLAGLSLIGTLAGCAAAADDAATGDSTSSSDTSTDAATDTTTDSSTDATTDATATESYTDGTYTAEGDYTSPGGAETITVELTLEHDIVTAVTVTPEATNPNSKKYQGEFADGIAAIVVGVDIDELEVDTVAGSSLTSTGFNEAVETIKADAAA